MKPTPRIHHATQAESRFDFLTVLFLELFRTDIPTSHTARALCYLAERLVPGIPAEDW